MLADGFSLDDKRTELDQSKHENNNIPDVVARWNNLSQEENRTKTEQSFFVTKEEIINNKYDLSINRYKEVVHEEVHYENPKEILSRIMNLESEMQKALAELDTVLNK